MHFIVNLRNGIKVETGNYWRVIIAQIKWLKCDKVWPGLKSFSSKSESFLCFWFSLFLKFIIYDIQRYFPTIFSSKSPSQQQHWHWSLTAPSYCYNYILGSYQIICESHETSSNFVRLYEFKYALPSARQFNI